MEYGNGWAPMIELDMTYVLYIGDFLSKGCQESFEQNILFRFSLPRKATRLGHADQPPTCEVTPPGRQQNAFRPGPHWQAASKVGLAWAFRNPAYHETILTTYVFSMYTHLSICVLIVLSSYPSMHSTFRVGADTF
jgi:hypothetical protein